MGSKAKITKYIVPIIQRKIDESGARYYVEPFAGGCNVIDKIKAEYRIASDSNKYLIALFQHLQDGGELPEHITREEYNKAREAYRTGDNSLQAWYIGAAGFLASYNGRFYDGGYAGYGKDKGRVRDYYRESRNNILMQMQQGGIFGIDFSCRDYNSFQTLDARDFGLPQARERVFTISVLNGEPFNFDDLIKTEMRDISEYLEKDVSEVYAVTQPSVYNAIGKKGIRRATVIKDYAYTITARQDRTPAQVIDLGGGKYRYLTERECWRLQGYSDADFEAAAAVQKKNGRYTMALYKQAGNSIPVTIFESIFRKIILGETAEKEASNE